MISFFSGRVIAAHDFDQFGKLNTEALAEGRLNICFAPFLHVTQIQSVTVSSLVICQRKLAITKVKLVIF